MLIDFFFMVKGAGVPVSIKEFLVLLEAMSKDVISPSLDDFYFLSRAALVKNEAHYDRFDQAFGMYFRGIEGAVQENLAIPEDWLKRMQDAMTPEQWAQVEKLGYDKLLDKLRELLEEQKERHEGGNKWIGTGGTSPFGHGGKNPEGIRLGEQGGARGAVKIWEARAFRDYDYERELGTRNIKVALRKLRRFAREGAADELAIDDTVRATADNAGWLDLRMRPERRNRIKVLMLLDVGGTMNEHARRTEELFSAARAEFRHLEFYYFHNCVYDTLWRSNQRRRAERFDTWDVLHRYPPDTRLIFVGDATMAPYEILHPTGSIEARNAEAGAVWLSRFTGAFPHYIWLNPEPEAIWSYRQSVDIIRKLMKDRMFPMTIDGLERGMRLLAR